MRETKPPLVFESGAGDSQLTATFADHWTIVADEGGAVWISVAQEQAVGSYNETLTSTIKLTAQQARQLREWLAPQ